ncbi:MAG: hypothetical protein OEV86_15775 [Candidatus Krumholzibacteria bacterium]|nr:hypothetical protein [Candidatus Krumholzibacteria bacterium]
MKDFNKSRQERRADDPVDMLEDRQFQLGDGVFTRLSHPPYQATKAMVEITENTDGLRVFSIVENAVLAMLEPQDRDRFRQVVANENDPISWEDLLEVAFWLVGEASGGRPTTRSQSSTDMSSEPGTDSTENSSLALVVD